MFKLVSYGNHLIDLLENSLTGFNMVLVFAEKYFCTEYNVVIFLSILSIYSNYCQQWYSYFK